MIRLLSATTIAALAIGAITRPILAQPGERLAFEVTSVKPNKSEDIRPGMEILPGGKFTVRNAPLRIVIVTAYNVPFQSVRMTGGPEWINSERYDIEATPPSGAFPAGLSDQERKNRMRQMLQSLLADRFKLVIKAETKELPRYALSVSKGGLKLPKSKMEEKDCPEMPAAGTPGCHNFMGGMGRGLHAKGASMDDLAQFIENWTDHPVVDTTGVQGLFEFETSGWTPMRGPMPRPPDPQAPPSPDGDMSDPTRPTLFMVLDKLGLSLKLEKGPVEVYVIENIERPAEN